MTEVSRATPQQHTPEMVARVAKAIGCIDADRCNGHVPSGTCEDCLEAARNAISAMREPTEEVLLAGIYQMPMRNDGYMSPLKVWFAMIDAALGK